MDFALRSTVEIFGNTTKDFRTRLLFRVGSVKQRRSRLRPSTLIPLATCRRHTPSSSFAHCFRLARLSPIPSVDASR